MNSLLDFAEEHCTNEVLEELKPVLNMYEKYESLMNTTSIQPQKTSKKNYEEPHLLFCVDDPTDREDHEVIFTATKRGVDIRFIFPIDGEHLGEDYFMTHEKCFEYLEQLPKNWHHFTELNRVGK